jgi:hypothetical protein
MCWGIRFCVVCWLERPISNKPAVRIKQAAAFGIRGIAVLVTCINDCKHDGLPTTNGLRMARSEALLREPSRSELRSKSHSGIHWMAKGRKRPPTYPKKTFGSQTMKFKIVFWKEKNEAPAFCQLILVSCSKSHRTHRLAHQTLTLCLSGNISGKKSDLAGTSHIDNQRVFFEIPGRHRQHSAGRATSHYVFKSFESGAVAQQSADDDGKTSL